MSPHHHNAQHDPPRFILASASPRRQALMREYGYNVEVMRPPLTEPKQLGHGLSPGQQAEALSYFKANSVADLVDRGIILAGDTVVALGRRIFGKPLDRDDARRMLESLAGTTHHVITGVTLLDAHSLERLIRHDSTAVTMRPLTDRQLQRHLDTRAWEGKAGAYGILERGDPFVERIEGSFTNVVGLPMELLAQMLAQWDARRHDAGR